MTIAEQYAKDVLSNKSKYPKLVIAACQRFEDDLKRKDIYFDREDAERYTAFMGEQIHLWEDEWRGEVMEIYPYMGFIIQNIFGWKVTGSGKRRFRDAYIQTPKKQAKTTLMAAIIWAHVLIDDSTSTPQVIVGANNEDQAKICVNCSGKMVDVSPMLSEFYHEGVLNRYQHGAGFFRVTYNDGDRDGTIESISKDAKTKAGRNASLWVIDEYAFAPKDDLLKELNNAQTLRTNPLGIVITTPGFDRYVPCYQKLRKSAISILNGIIQMDGRFVLLFEPDEDDDWENEKTWLKVVPILKHVPKVLDVMRLDYRTAKEEGGHSVVDFKTKNLGMWCDSAATWVDDKIILGNNHGITLDKLKGRKCYVGWDFSKAKDLSCMALNFPNVGIYNVVLMYYWIPSDKIRSTEDDVDYQLWVDQGWIEVHEGNVLDHDLIGHRCHEILSEYNVFGIGFDQKYAYQGAVSYLAKRGYENKLFPVGQGFNLSAAVGRVEELALKEMYDFMGNPVTRWCFANVEMKVGEKGDRYPSKKDQSKKKIDGVSCILNATTIQMKLDSEPEKEVGLVWLK